MKKTETHTSKTLLRLLLAGIALLLCGALFCGAAGAVENATSGTSGGIQWNISDSDDGKTLIISPADNPEAKYTSGQMKDYTDNDAAPWMPLKDSLTRLVIEKGVTTIGNGAFQDCCNFTGLLTIPESVTTIGDDAFQSCYSFTGPLTIPESVTTIGATAFWGCYGFSGHLVIPAGVTSIGGGAFAACIGITEISVAPGNSNFTTVNGVLYDKKKTTVICCPAGKNGTFDDLQIPDTVTKIGDHAFGYCIGLTGPLVIPAGITTIDSGAFIYCRGFTGSLVISDGVTTIGDFAFFDCQGFKSLTLGNSVTKIGVAAFQGCRGFTGRLIIPANITTIEQSAFCYCSGFTGSLELPDGVTSIGDYAFFGCSNLTGSLVIPVGVATIGNGAFSECPGITEISVSPGNSNFTTINGVLYDKEKTTLIYCPAEKTGTFVDLQIPDTITKIDDYAFDDCSNLTGPLVLPAGITTIGSHAFINCSGLTGPLVIPAGVMTIGDYAFYNCIGLTGSLEIPAGVTTIGSGAFSACSGITEISVSPGNSNFTTVNGVLYDKEKTTVICCPAGKTGTFVDLQIPDTVTKIGNGAFRKCSGLTGPLVIPAGVTTIGDYAFYNCIGLTGSLEIPAGVTTIGSGAFSACSGITEISVASGNNNFTTVNGVLYDKEKTTVICCPAGKTGTFDDLQIPDMVTKIGNYAFSACSGFTGSLVIPAGVTTIGDRAFSRCTGVSIIYTAGDPSFLEKSQPPEKVALAATNGGKITDIPTEPALAIPEKTGYIFAGWYKNASFSGDPVTTYEPSGKYYAKWTVSQKSSTSSSPVPFAGILAGLGAAAAVFALRRK